MTKQKTHGAQCSQKTFQSTIRNHLLWIYCSNNNYTMVLCQKIFVLNFIILLMYMSIKCIKDVTEYNYSIFEIKGVVDWFSSRLDCVYGVQSNMC